MAVWHITEAEDFFIEALGYSIDILENLKGRRRVEWLASRMLLQHLLPSTGRIEICKDEFGKPYVNDVPNVHISISHTRDFAAAIISDVPVGIDIQVPVSKIFRIAHKYLSEEELEKGTPLSMETLHVFWGAKESMYKIYGRREVDFRKHLQVSELDDKRGSLVGKIKMPDLDCEVDLTYELDSDFILVCGIIADPTGHSIR